jgi:nucleotide sugar dehydrogenase
MPLAQAASLAGLSVIGFDTSAETVRGLRAGKSHVDDLSDDEVGSMLTSGFLPTTEAADLADCDCYVICVPTPLSEEGGPDLDAVRAAGRTLADVIHPGCLVVLESTSYPGTTERVLRPILEESGLVAGTDFRLAFSPERIDPGNSRFGFRNTPKVVGGLTEECRDAAVAFYSRIVDRVVPAAGLKEAELAKLLENTYRQVNIALVNEMARFCHDLGIDLWDSIECAATKPFGFQPFYPGPGVGGHCIPIDPNYLSHHVRSETGYGFRFVELAQEINASMPHYVASRVQAMLNRDGVALNGARVLLVGVTYKADIADTRESPSRDVASALLRSGASVSFLDPFVDRWVVDGTEVERVVSEADARDADCVVLLQHHRVVDLETVIDSAVRLLDTRGKLDAARGERL